MASTPPSPGNSSCGVCSKVIKAGERKLEGSCGCIFHDNCAIEYRRSVMQGGGFMSCPVCFVSTEFRPLGAPRVADRKGMKRKAIVCSRSPTGSATQLRQAARPSPIVVRQGADAFSREERWFCRICGQVVGEPTPKQHLLSIGHNLRVSRPRKANPGANLGDHSDKFDIGAEPPPSFGIERSNKGFQMLISLGWDEVSGLGADCRRGRVLPLETQLRRGREGLGIRQKPKRVTHFPSHKGVGDISAASVCAAGAGRPPGAQARMSKAAARQAMRERSAEIRRELSGINMPSTLV